ncbi:carbohydrate ABC transporter permease, partial [Azospirillum brasilense]|nr:carbohydrate ABC transporter permease [Azospirillum brasilense]
MVGLRRIAFALVVLGIVAWAVFPFAWAIVTSLKAGSALFTVEAWPSQPSLANYAVIVREEPVGRNIRNSLMAASAVVALSLGLAVLA